MRAPIQLDGISGTSPALTPGKYASAAYVSALSKGEKTLNKVESDLKVFHDLLNGKSEDASKLRTFLTNPTISSETRDKVLSAISGPKGGADDITRYVCTTNAATCWKRSPRTGV